MNVPSVADHLQYEYAAQILLVATIALSKLSLGLLFKNLMTSRRSLLASQVLVGVVVAWGIASILALALRCSIPAPWKWNHASQCIDQVRLPQSAWLGPFAKTRLLILFLQIALFQAIGALNIVTDIALVLLPCVMLRKVQLSRWKRFRIMAMLASRLL